MIGTATIDPGHGVVATLRPGDHVDDVGSIVGDGWYGGNVFVDVLISAKASISG